MSSDTRWEQCVSDLAGNPALMDRMMKELCDKELPACENEAPKHAALTELLKAAQAAGQDPRARAAHLLESFAIDNEMKCFWDLHGDYEMNKCFRDAYLKLQKIWQRNPLSMQGRVKGSFVGLFKEVAGPKFVEMWKEYFPWKWQRWERAQVLKASPPITGLKRGRESVPSTSAPIDNVEEKAARAERFRAEKNAHAERFSTDNKVKAKEALAPKGSADTDHVNESGPNKKALNANRMDKSGLNKKADTKQAARRVDVLGPNKEANDKVQEAPPPNNIGGDTPDIVNGAPTSNNTVPTAGAPNIAAEMYISNDNVPIAEAPQPNIISGGAPIIVNGAPTSNDVVPATVPVDGKAREIQAQKAPPPNVDSGSAPASAAGAGTTILGVPAVVGKCQANPPVNEPMHDTLMEDVSRAELAMNEVSVSEPNINTEEIRRTKFNMIVGKQAEIYFLTKEIMGMSAAIAVAFDDQMLNQIVSKKNRIGSLRQEIASMLADGVIHDVKEFAQTLQAASSS